MSDNPLKATDRYWKGIARLIQTNDDLFSLTGLSNTTFAFRRLNLNVADDQLQQLGYIPIRKRESTEVFEHYNFVNQTKTRIVFYKKRHKVAITGNGDRTLCVDELLAILKKSYELGWK